MLGRRCRHGEMPLRQIRVSAPTQCPSPDRCPSPSRYQKKSSSSNGALRIVPARRELRAPRRLQNLGSEEKVKKQRADYGWAAASKSLLATIDIAYRNNRTAVAVGAG